MDISSGAALHINTAARRTSPFLEGAASRCETTGTQRRISPGSMKNAGGKSERRFRKAKEHSDDHDRHPHLNFRGTARDALDFCAQVFGGEQMVLTYAMAGQAGQPADHVIWGQVASDDGFRIMAYDVQAERGYEAGTNAFYVSLRGDDAATVQARWTALAEGATVLQPIGPSQWSALYGMLVDRFGVTWVVDLAN